MAHCGKRLSLTRQCPQCVVLAMASHVIVDHVPNDFPSILGSLQKVRSFRTVRGGSIREFHDRSFSVVRESGMPELNETFQILGPIFFTIIVAVIERGDLLYSNTLECKRSLFEFVLLLVCLSSMCLSCSLTIASPFPIAVEPTRHGAPTR